MKKEITYLNNYFTGCKTGAERSIYSDELLMKKIMIKYLNTGKSTDILEYLIVLKWA